MVRLTFDRGTLLLHDLPPELAARIPGGKSDERVGALRAPASSYHLVVRHLVAQGVAFEDEAREYEVHDFTRQSGFAPRDYQSEAVAAWENQHRRGVVVLPTGSGKTLVAELAIEATGRSALVVVPTLDLLNQWFDLLADRFGAQRVGAIGGGTFEPRPLTVITYDSAYLHLDRLGSRYGLLICDEAHHLPGPSYVQAAHMSLAPYRLGLTATPPEGERLECLSEALGGIAYARGITDLAGDYLSDYEIRRLEVKLSDAEREAYDAAYGRYRGFVTANGIRLGGANGWARFLRATSQSEEGRAALAAWREQRRISLASPQKLDHLEAILSEHRAESTIVFTWDNATAYAVSRRFLVPAITHQTKPRERRAILAGLRDGTLPVVATSRVLNEGVDVPSVSVGVVLSGTATVREHVQRLGRILRQAEGKHAVLYEVVTLDTGEVGASRRRRDHAAYKTLSEANPC
jgi:superfamily II DNA or RNA helicase